MSNRNKDHKPFIGINTDYYAPKKAPSFFRLNSTYLESTLLAEGVPLILPTLDQEHFSELDRYLDLVSAVILTGGLDLDPRRFGMQPGPANQSMSPKRENFDRYLLEQIIERKLPLLAIGAGMQLLNVYMGGTLFMHLPAEPFKAMAHFDPNSIHHMHTVRVEQGTLLRDIYGAEELRVNSMHHQAVNKLGNGLKATAFAPDGIIEALESTDEDWFCIGVQFHPECRVTGSALDRQIFGVLMQAAAKYETSREFALVN